MDKVLIGALIGLLMVLGTFVLMVFFAAIFTSP